MFINLLATMLIYFAWIIGVIGVTGLLLHLLRMDKTKVFEANTHEADRQL